MNDIKFESRDKVIVIDDNLIIYEYEITKVSDKIYYDLYERTYSQARYLWSEHCTYSSMIDIISKGTTWKLIHNRKRILKEILK